MSSSSSARRRCLAGLAALLLVAPAARGARATVAPSPEPAACSPAGKVLMNREEALALAFGTKAKVTRGTAYLEPKQVAAVAKAAKVPFEKTVVYPYRATDAKGKWIGTAYFDTHRVRALRETLMVVVRPDGSLDRVEVLSFAEPHEYLPRAAFYDQFKGRKLDADLNLKRKIRNVTGASLTSKATTHCARRVLALHEHLERERRREEEERKKRAKRKGPEGVASDGRP